MYLCECICKYMCVSSCVSMDRVQNRALQLSVLELKLCMGCLAFYVGNGIQALILMIKQQVFLTSEQSLTAPASFFLKL